MLRDSSKTVIKVHRVVMGARDSEAVISSPVFVGFFCRFFQNIKVNFIAVATPLNRLTPLGVL